MGELVAALLDERVEALSIEAEQDHDHRPRRERKHAQGQQIDNELFGLDRAERAGANRRGDLLTDLLDQQRTNVFGRGAGGCRNQQAHPLGMMVQFADDVAGQPGRSREVIDFDLDDLANFVFQRQVGRQHLDDLQKELACSPPENGLGKPVLGAEVIVEQCLVHARGLGDVEHARAGGSVLDKHRVRRVENAALGAAVAARRFRDGGHAAFRPAGVVTVFVRNAYCRFLCPVGAALGVISQVTTVFSIKRWKECNTCKICEKACEWGAIQGPKIVKSECVRCDDCERLYADTKKCPHWIILLKDLKKAQPTLAAPSR
jgi:NAD-dependent dihydropyrimidine dehydrogenase PreA subunit